MPRQSITLSDPNDAWLLQQAKSGEFQNKSEVINSLIRDARKDADELAWVRAAITEGEQSGISTRSADDIRQSVKSALRANGEI